MTSSLFGESRDKDKTTSNKKNNIGLYSNYYEMSHKDKICNAKVEWM